MLCPSQKTNELLPVILSGVKEIIDKNNKFSDGAKKENDKLLNEYSNNHVLLRGAFPSLFLFGLTAESIGGGGPLKKKTSTETPTHQVSVITAKGGK